MLTKMQERAALAMARGGSKGTEIARQVGVHPSTITRLLQREKAAVERVDAYRESRADILASIQHNAQELQEKLLGLLGEDEALEGLTRPQQIGLLQTLGTLSGIAYDKERLEVGKSTSNVAGILSLARQEADRIAGIDKLRAARKRKEQDQE